MQLGKLDIKTYIRKFTSPEKPIGEIIKEIEERKAFEHKYNLPPNLHYESPPAKRLKGLLDVLQYSFEKWVQNCQKIFTDPKLVKVEKYNTFFINFNYTDTLQWLYEIPDERVMQIHGRASKHDHLIFGHNSILCGNCSVDEEKVCFELNKYEKKPYEYICKHNELLDILKDVEYVHVYGFSFSPVDENYMDWIYHHVPKKSQWEVSWYSDTDMVRIDRFIMNRWGLKDTMKLIKLEDIVK